MKTRSKSVYNVKSRIYLRGMVTDENKRIR